MANPEDEIIFYPDLCVRVTLPFQDCSGIIHRWFNRATKAICYEHVADQEVSKTHVHLALIGLSCKTEALKRMWADAPGKGNEFWSFTTLRLSSEYLTYMTKGRLRPVLVKNFSPAEVEEHRKLWVEPVKVAKSGDSSEHMINLVLKRFKFYECRQDYIQHYIDVKFASSDTVYHSNDDYAKFLLAEVRSATMKVYWGETKRVPHATQYKIVAGSVFLRLCELFCMFEAGVTALQNLWY